MQTRALIVMPLATRRGGSEVQLEQLIEHRREAGIEPTVAFLEPGPMVQWCADHGVTVALVHAGRVREARRLGGTGRTLVRLAHQERAQVIVGWMAKGQIYAGLAAAAARLPSVWFQPALPSRLAPIDRLATLLPTRLVVTNSRATDREQGRLWPRRATRIVYPAVDLARFDAVRIGEQRAVRQRLGLPEHGPIFGSVGRLNSWKGFHVLLDAVPNVLAHHPTATFVLVGGRHELEPAYADRLQAQAARLNENGRVQLVGHQPNPEAWMQAMDVFVHTSHNEPFGMVVIEAMALGKPVVAAAEGGPLEIITPGVDGLLSPYGDDSALAREIGRLLGDEHLRQTIGRAAVGRARDFTVQRYAREAGAALADTIRERR